MASPTEHIFKWYEWLLLLTQIIQTEKYELLTLGFFHAGIILIDTVNPQPPILHIERGIT